MVLTSTQHAEFCEVAKPLIKWLNDNCHPHCSIIITTTHAELLEGIAATETTEFLKD